METQMLVADKYRLARANGEFVEAGKVLHRKGQKVLKDYLDQVNAESKLHGWFFVVDEKATKELIEAQEKKKAERAITNTAKSSDAKELVQALVDVVKEGVKQPESKEVEIPTGIPNEEWTKEQLQAYLSENKIEFKDSFSVKKLLDLATGGANA